MPVPIIDIANEVGADVFESELNESISGYVCKADTGKYEIVVNESHPATRKRFTIAHEIAHILLHGSILSTQKKLEDFSKRSAVLTRQKGTNSKIEREADKLAAELLMPEDIFKQVWNSSDSVEEVAKYFNVSQAAATVRGGILTKQTML